MEMAYLGLFSKIFNWVLDRIFNPIFKWLTNLLTTIFTWIFNEILAPILLPILEEVLQFAIELYKDIYAVHMYALFSTVLKLIDYLEAAFDVFIGIDEVTYYGNAGTTIKGSLLEVLLQQETISKVFWLLTCGGLALALLLTIYGVAKSSFDLDFENKRPVSKVLTAMMKTFVQFFTVPFFVYFIVKLAAIILQGITYVLNQGNNTTLGRIIFMIASLDAANDANYNVSTSKLGITLGTTPADTVRYPFYSLTAAGAKDYGDISVVMDSFDLSNFDYLIGAIAAIFLFFTIAVCLIKFVQRIFEVILLYIVSPYFVSTIPLDDGEKFGRWREMFVGKCFSGFGSAVGMRLYLMVCPMIMGGTIDFGASAEMDYIMKLFFLAGGAWAVFKSGPMITNLISFQAGQDESMTQAAAGGFMYAQTAGRMGRAVSSAMHGRHGGGSQAKAGKREASPDQAFKNTKLQPAGKVDGHWKAGVKPTGPRSGKVTIGANRGHTDWKSAKPAGGARSGISMGAHRGTAMQADRQAEHHNLRLGSLFQSTYDNQGNHKFRVMGFGFTADAAGNTTSMKFPGLKLQAGSSGGYQVSKLHLPGVVNYRSNVQNGNVSYSDVSVLGGIRYQRGSDGQSRFGIGNSLSVSRAADGSYDHVKVGAFTRSHSSDGQKTYGLGSAMQVSRSAEGNTVQFGSQGGVSFRSEAGKSGLSGVKIGALEYSRSGITKSTTKTGGGKA